MTATVQSPTPARRRAAITWTLIGLFVLIIGAIGAVLSGIGAWNARDVLDPESASPDGARALASILAEQGVEVAIETRRDRAAELLAAGPATLVLPDAPALSDDALEELAAAATDVVLVDPRSRSLRVLLDARTSGYGASLLAPQCALPEAERSGRVAPGLLFTADGTADVPATACYPTGEGAGLLVLDDGERRIAAVDGRELFVNERLTEDGNAALALNLMGRHALVVWYVPGLDDTDLPAGDPTLGELTPPWVSPVIVLLLFAGAAAAIWRGRRFGPLVTERLPVTVRAAETTEGRARLYAHSRDALHAADQLRLGTIDRLARMLGLGPAAAAGDVADAAASRTGLDRAAVRSLLIDELPDTDTRLVAVHSRLTHLEEAVRAAVRPERTPPR
ncbi:DUF4350 domain-containing protein [Microbacterium awajiense]|uniref:DUF4350 domain-containing protein n=1 Tax=Microbacterium awajiense TaxID=415214 RepID=A0ABP7AE35_9MICO